MQNNPFASLPEMALQFVEIRDGQTTYTVVCKHCGCWWYVPNERDRVPIEPLDLFRPIWHVFEKHLHEVCDTAWSRALAQRMGKHIAAATDTPRRAA